jgi:two-component system nitrogen regulation response regulator NtrX
MKVTEEDLPSGFVGRSPRIVQLRGQIEKLGIRRSPVLIQGESGTGKEVAARSLFNAAPRGQFVPIDCGSLVGTMMESELFGHVRGAFTGAVDNKRGLIDLANGGTAFFDEIGEIPIELQVKLLRVLQEQELRPLGSLQRIKIDVRIVAATNRDLQKEVAAGRFREDLFHRLNVVRLTLPPLRERKEDIPVLARHFLKEFSSQYSRRTKEIADEALEVLTRYSWPGNVRELRNVIERIVIMNPTVQRLERKHLPSVLYREGSRRSLGDFTTLHQARAAYERDYILKKLDENNGNVSRTAEVLGLERSHLYRKMKTLGIAVKE